MWLGIWVGSNIFDSDLRGSIWNAEKNRERNKHDIQYDVENKAH